jgi:hypothetical protein
LEREKEPNDVIYVQIGMMNFVLSFVKVGSPSKHVSYVHIHTPEKNVVNFE